MLPDRIIFIYIYIYISKDEHNINKFYYQGRRAWYVSDFYLILILLLTLALTEARETGMSLFPLEKTSQGLRQMPNPCYLKRVEAMYGQNSIELLSYTYFDLLYF